jgi:hypothetical protein
MNGYAGGASAVFPDRALESGTRQLDTAQRWRSRLFPAGGLLWAAREASGLELVAHGDPRGIAACHGDTGRGSFEIWHRGRSIVVDGGMPTYADGRVREHFRGHAGQNVVAIDGLAPSLLHDQVPDVPRWYWAGSEGQWLVDETSATFEWRGFGRARPGLTWSRTWHWCDAELVVEDRVHGCQAEIDVSAYLHLGVPGWGSPAPGRFTSPGASIRYAGPESLAPRLIEAPISPDYGIIEQAQAIELSGRAWAPVSWRWIVSVEAGV